MEESYLPLTGIKVVELSTMVAASSCGRMLADWGCEIVKVETEKGDMFRFFPKTFYVPCTDDENPLFDNLNAGKRGVVLDLKTPEGMEAIHRMLSEADVFLTNTRPQALKRLGLDYDSLKDKYPKLIHASVNGFGEKGPKANNPGFDTVAFWASSGFNVDMSLEGPNSYPVYGSAGPGDIITAMGLCYAIAAALYKRTQTGLGDRVYSSLYGTALWCFNIMTVSCEKRYGNHFPHSRENSAPTSSSFKTKDGEWIMTTVMKIEEQWPKLCHVLGLDELANDPRYNTSEGQRNHENRKYLMKLFEEAYVTKTADEWSKLLTEVDIVNDKMAHFSDMETSEQAWANEYIHEVTCPNGKKSVLVRPSMRSEKMGIPKWKRGPMLGEHTVEVLEELGYSKEQIEKILASHAAKGRQVSEENEK
jgi:(R)-2-hydroxy-4-methylpentanoate CoA-transferase